MFTSFVPSFAADSIPLPPSELWVNRPPLGVHVPPTRAYCRSRINSRLAVYPMDPYCTIHLVYMSSKSSLLCVSIGAVLFRQDLDIYDGATIRCSGGSASVFRESTTGANGRSAARGRRRRRRRTSIDIIPEAVAHGFHC